MQVRRGFILAAFWLNVRVGEVGDSEGSAPGSIHWVGGMG